MIFFFTKPSMNMVCYNVIMGKILVNIDVDTAAVNHVYHVFRIRC